MAYYRKRSYKRRGRRNGFRSKVQRIINSNIETKAVELTTQSISGKVTGTTSWNALKPLTQEISKGPGAGEFVGDVITAKGLRLDITADNSAENSPAPVYCTFMVLLSYEGNPSAHLFKNHLSGADNDYATLTEQDRWSVNAERANVRPLATDKFKVIFKKQFRLGCRAAKELEGPYFKQSKVYIPMNTKLGMKTTRKPELYLVMWGNNPTTVNVKTTETNGTKTYSSTLEEDWGMRVVPTLYFKDA